MASQSIRNTRVEKRVGLPYTLILLSGPLLMRVSDRLKPEISLFLNRVAKVGLVFKSCVGATCVHEHQGNYLPNHHSE
jgi:hypothetical protein